MSKKRIAIYCNVFETVVGQGIAYMNFFSEFGDVTIVTSESDLNRVVKEYDILALPGGKDIFSGLYSKAPGFNSKDTNSHYEYLDEHLLMPWLKTGKPIIAICRGMQTLNVRMGGTLFRHIAGHEQDQVRHPRSEAMMMMYLEPSVVDVHGKPINFTRTNSFHHQAIHRLADGFEVLGWGDCFLNCPSLRADKGIGYLKSQTIWEDVGDRKKENWVKTFGKYHTHIELIRHKTLPYIGFQYHPEEMMDDLSLSLCHEMLDNYFNNKKQNTYAYEIKSSATASVK